MVRRPHLSPAVARFSIAAVLSLGVVAGGCGGDDDTAATPATSATGAAPTTMADNPFIPEDVNIGDCVSALPRPGCGNEIRGDSHSALTFGVLVAGLAFIGWRIARSVRRRDRSQTPAGPGEPPSAPPAPTPPA